MPITIFPSPSKTGHNRKPVVKSSQSLLQATAQAWAPSRPIYGSGRLAKVEPEGRPILSSSFQDLASAPVVPMGNALVSGILEAFQQDLHLALRPDDVWLAILTQFSFYVNANSEKLRDHFVAFEGKKKLEIDCRPMPVATLMDDFGMTAQILCTELETLVVDPELHEWMLPKFSTTTDEDRGIASIVMMGTLQKYVEFVVWGGCGFPSVTVLGEAEDWQLILARIQKLSKYGEQPAIWSKLLTAILKRIIATFYIPDSQEIKDFWLSACHSDGIDGSGPGREYLSGWITAFCFWTEEGRPLDCTLYAAGESIGRGVVDTKKQNTAADLTQKGVKPLQLDKAHFHLIYPNGGLESYDGRPGSCTSIPKSVVTVPVSFRDFATRVQTDVTMVAGLVGMTLGKTSSEQDCYQPRSGWWMLQDSVEKF